MPIVVRELAQIKISKDYKELLGILDRNLIFVQASDSVLKLVGCKNKKTGLKGLTYYDLNRKFKKCAPKWEQASYDTMLKKKP